LSSSGSQTDPDTHPDPGAHPGLEAGAVARGGVAAYGTRLPDGRQVACHTLGDPSGVELQVSELGATVHQLNVTDARGHRHNVVLGHATLAEYLTSTHYFGATVGRYANRIAGGAFTLDGRQITIAVNEGGNALHGGLDGFNRRVWTTTNLGASSVTMELDSPHSDQGFPGALHVAVTFEVADCEVRIRYGATTDRPTVVSLTNHSYFNLDGEGAGSVDAHLLSVESDHFTPVGAGFIPTGALAPVEGTPFDWREPAPVGIGIRRQHDQIRCARGLDHNFVVRGTGLRQAATLASPANGLRLTVLTDQPGIQVYTGNSLDGSVVGTSGQLYRQGDGIALETQHFPDSPNHPAFPSTVLRPGKELRSTTVWRFAQMPLVAAKPPS